MYRTNTQMTDIDEVARSSQPMSVRANFRALPTVNAGGDETAAKPLRSALRRKRVRWSNATQGNRVETPRYEVSAQSSTESILRYDIEKLSMCYAFWLTVVSCVAAFLFANADHLILAGALATNGTMSGAEFLRALQRGRRHESDET